jgi:hypothetical protein
VKPLCGNCQKRNPPATACVYTDDTLKRGSSKYVDSLRARIKELEGILGLYAPDLDLRRGSTISIQDRATSSPQSQLPSDQEAEAVASRPNDEESWDSVDGMGPQSGLPPASRAQKRSGTTFFGPSSVFGFMKQAEHTDHDQLQSFTLATPASGDFGVQRHVQARIVLPPRANADALVEGYFHIVHSLYPFLSQSEFRSRYATIMDRTLPKDDSTTLSSEERTFCSLINAVFALGVHFTPTISPQRRVRESEVYFSRSMSMLSFDMLAQGSIELVQTLLLLAQYLQSTDLPGLCWNIAGIAIRVAQSLGLHSELRYHCRVEIHADYHFTVPRSLSYTTTSEEFAAVELRKRLWGGCMTLDR